MPKQRPFIDMHTHLFTARYLPLHAIFFAFGVPNLLARGLAALANAITGVSDLGSPDDEDPLEEKMVQALMARDAEAVMDAMSRRARLLIRRYQRHAETSPEDHTRLEEALSGLDDLGEATDYDNSTFGPVSTQLLHKDVREFSVFGGDESGPDVLDQLLTDAFRQAGDAVAGEDFLHDAAHLHLDLAPTPEEGAMKRLFGLDDSQIKGLSQVLIFVAVMVLSEKARYKVLQIDYNRGKPADGYDASHYVGLLMDMYESYAERHGRNFKRPHFEFKEQMTRMGQLAQSTDGRLISFGAVDPFRSNDWKSYVQHGLKHGAKGFKIYPPLGFRPVDDLSEPTPVNDDAEGAYHTWAGRNAPSAHAQRAMSEILPYFARNDLRMFTHCTPIGFQVETGFGVFTDPWLWRRAMEEYNAEDLWLFLGHGGGTTKVDWFGWAAATDEEFEKTFAYRAVKLVEEFDNVYLGLGYIFEILGDEVSAHIGNGHTHEPSPSQLFVARLAKCLIDDKPASAKHHFRDKVCYGTDWSMPRAIGRTRRYLNSFYDFFDHLDLDEVTREEVAHKFFEGNARRYLGLPPRVGM